MSIQHAVCDFVCLKKEYSVKKGLCQCWKMLLLILSTMVNFEIVLCMVHLLVYTDIDLLCDTLHNILGNLLQYLYRFEMSSKTTGSVIVYLSLIHI